MVDAQKLRAIFNNSKQKLLTVEPELSSKINSISLKFNSDRNTLGSYKYHANELTLSQAIVGLTEEEIETVIFHEFCHLITEYIIHKFVLNDNNYSEHESSDLSFYDLHKHFRRLFTVTEYLVDNDFIGEVFDWNTRQIVWQNTNNSKQDWITEFKKNFQNTGTFTPSSVIFMNHDDLDFEIRQQGHGKLWQNIAKKIGDIFGYEITRYFDESEAEGAIKLPGSVAKCVCNICGKTWYSTDRGLLSNPNNYTHNEDGGTLRIFDVRGSSENLIKESYLNEDTRQQLAIKSRTAGPYKDQRYGKNRYERRNRSRIATSVKQYNKIDMNQLFKNDRLEVQIPVIGETDNYDVTVRVDGVVAEIARNIKINKYKLEFRTVIQSLTKVFNTKDVYVNCTCLDKNTKIKLLDGTAPSVEEMKLRFDAGEQLYVYSVDENGDFVPGVVEGVYITGKRDHFIEVTLDNGEKIRTTPDHPYLLRNGQYIEAQQLKIGQSLMPLYFDRTNTGYETVKFNSTGKYHSTYKVVGNTFYPQEILNKQKDAMTDGSNENMYYDVAIHHKDFNKNNNSPDNLKIIIRDAKYIKVFNKMIEDGVDITEENYELYRITYFKTSPRLKNHFNSITEATSYFKLNHKIIDIKELYCEADDVYDIKVKDYHNFLVNAGVILHNCPDFTYNFKHWSVINNYGTTDSAHDPGAGKGIANPNNDKGKGCKHIMLILANGDWMMKVASVINNYLHYMSEKMHKQFLKLIFPKLYGCDAEEMSRLDILGKEEVEETLDSNTSFIDAINEYGKNRGKIKKGSNRNTANRTIEPEEQDLSNQEDPNKKNLAKAEAETAAANAKAAKEAEEYEKELEDERQRKIEAANAEDNLEGEEND